MSHLQTHQEELSQLRFSPMCKPAAEVAHLTKLESHSLRGRMMMLWRITAGMSSWGAREVALIYQSTLDSISEAFDVFHYPVSQYMLAARRDIWESGLAPDCVRQAIEQGSHLRQAAPHPQATTILLAGELAQLGDSALLDPLLTALQACQIEAQPWIVPSGALPYVLGDWDTAADQARQVISGLAGSGTTTIIVDGPETAWALRKIYPALGITLPPDITVKLLSDVIAEHQPAGNIPAGPVFVHDSRPACFLADHLPTSLAIMPGYTANEDVFGTGDIYNAARNWLNGLGVQRVFSGWTRALARSSGADDGLWLTYPQLAAGLAELRLAEAQRLGAATLVTDSPLAAAFLAKHSRQRDITIKLLAELVAETNATT